MFDFCLGVVFVRLRLTYQLQSILDSINDKIVNIANPKILVFQTIWFGHIICMILSFDTINLKWICLQIYYFHF